MIAKIKNALKTEYAKMGLGDKALDGVASFLAKTITSEEGIDGVIKSEDTMNLLKAFQGESDSLRNRAAQLEKDFNAYKESHPEGGGEADRGKQTEEPEWAKKLREQQESIAKRLDEQDRVRRNASDLASVRSILEKEGCTNKGILNATLKGFSLGENETVESASARLKTEYQASFKETFGDGPVPPISGNVFGDDPKKAADAKNEFLRSSGLLPKENK